MVGEFGKKGQKKFWFDVFLLAVRIRGKEYFMRTLIKAPDISVSAIVIADETKAMHQGDIVRTETVL